MRHQSALYRHRLMYRLASSFLTVIFLFTCIFPPDIGYSQIYSSLNLPVPGTMVFQTTGFVPTMIKGIEIDLENPLSFNFIIDTGDSGLEGKAFEEESLRLIKYFLASLTVPEEEMWVNLSPYEKDRIIPEDFGRTAMGMDLLAEDYLLKQLTASLMYPEKELGQKFWDRVYARAKKEWGTTDIPVDAFHKVWIVPKDAEVVQIGNRAFVAKSSLEVMLEQDYFAVKSSRTPGHQDTRSQVTSGDAVTGDAVTLSKLQTEIMREIILPEIEKEVNEGENFANLRQIYQGMILATWFKVTLKESLLGKIYVNQNKVTGVESPDPAMTQTVYDRYIEAFQKGVYNYIKEDPDSETGNVIPRHYFSGGFSTTGRDGAMLSAKVAQTKRVIDPKTVNGARAQIEALTIALHSENSHLYSIGVNLNSPEVAESLRSFVWTEEAIDQLDSAYLGKFIRIYEELIRSNENKIHGLALMAPFLPKESTAVSNETQGLLDQNNHFQDVINLLQKRNAWLNENQLGSDSELLTDIRMRYPHVPDLVQRSLIEQLRKVTSSRSYVVHDVTLEAIHHELKGDAQTALGKGGLGFLAGETFGAYHNALGFMPLYDHTKGGVVIDWDDQKGIERVYVRGKDGQPQALVLDVEMGGRIYKTEIYWVNRNGTPVFLFRNAEIFDELYPDPDSGRQRMGQYGFMGKAYVALVNYLGIGPNILRLNEAQLVFVEKAVQNDLQAKGQKSFFANRRTVMTNHTPERAALPIFRNDRAWLEGLLGKDLIDDDMYRDENGDYTLENGRPVIRASEVLARKAFIITTVSEEHAEVTKRHVLPQFAWKTTFIQNGSDPEQWHSQSLLKKIEEKGFDAVAGEDLFEVGQEQKPLLNQWLAENGFNQFSNLDRPLFAAVRRVLTYKEQGIFIAMARWMTGDVNKMYETPWGHQAGLGGNFLIGGPVSDSLGQQWADEYRRLQDDPALKGKLVFIDKTGTDIMGLATSAADVWLESPRPTREASGTSHQRALLNGKLVIASATGGQLAVIEHGKNSWMVDVFQTGGFTASFDQVADALDDPNHPRYHEFVARYRAGAQRLFGQYMTEAVSLYRAYKNDGDKKILEMMSRAFRDSHKKISIGTMMRDYEELFVHVLNGTGAAGYESRQVPASPDVVSLQGINDFVSEKYRLDGRSVALERFLSGRGPAVDVIYAVQESSNIDQAAAQEVVISAWLAAAYDLLPDRFSIVMDAVSGNADMASHLGISEDEQQNFLNDVQDLKQIIMQEYELRRIDADMVQGRQIAPEMQHETRKRLANFWKSLAGRRDGDGAMLTKIELINENNQNLGTGGGELVTNEDVTAVISGLLGSKEGTKKGGGFLGVGAYHNLDIALARESDAIVLFDNDPEVVQWNMDVLKLIEETEDFSQVEAGMNALLARNPKRLPKNCQEHIRPEGFHVPGAYPGRTPLLWVYNEAHYRRLRGLILDGKVAVANVNVLDRQAMSLINDFFKSRHVPLDFVNLSNVEVHIAGQEGKLLPALKAAGVHAQTEVLASANITWLKKINDLYATKTYMRWLNQNVTIKPMVGAGILDGRGEKDNFLWDYYIRTIDAFEKGIILNNDILIRRLTFSVEKDEAMLSSDVGGIDLNAAFLDLKIRRDDQGFVLPLSQQPLDELMDVSGLIPVIINITPVQSLPMLLGIKEPEEDLAKAL